MVSKKTTEMLKEDTRDYFSLFSYLVISHCKARENQLDPCTGLFDPGAAANNRRRLRLPPPAVQDAGCHGVPGRRRPPWLVAEVLRTGQLPDNFIGALSDWF